MTIHPIAHMRSDFPAKFGIPRQSGLVQSLRGHIIFTPDYRDPAAVRGLADFSHLWLIWGFSETDRDGWSPTVRPPRLGGNTRMGVFATRSPNRPNPLGLSAVALDGVEEDGDQGIILRVRGGDLLDGTPIYDIKPYVPYADCIADASGGFAAATPMAVLEISISDALLARLPSDKRGALMEVLALDPRPGYQDDPERVYGFVFAGFEIRFRVTGCVLTVVDVFGV